jgi:hypothetical protein
MGANQSQVSIMEAVKSRPPIAQGKTRICVAGFKISHHTGRARKIADEIQKHEPAAFDTWFYFSWPGEYRPVLQYLKENDFKPFIDAHPDHQIAQHQTSPIVWIEKLGENGAIEVTPIGGRDRFCEWATEKYKDIPAINQLISTDPGLGDAWVEEGPGTSQPQYSI